MKNTRCLSLLAIVAGAYLVNRLGHRWGATDEEVYTSPLLLPADFIMARTMLRTIKRRVEQSSASTPGKTEQQEPVVFLTTGDA